MVRRISRREALRELGGLFAIPFIRWSERLSDPLAGTIVEYQAGRARGDWSAADVTKEAIDRSQAWNGTLHAIDLWSATAMGEARDSDVRYMRNVFPLLDLGWRASDFPIGPRRWSAACQV